MTKNEVESHVRAILHHHFDLTHEGNHVWVSQKVPTTVELGGVFFALFSHVSLRVQADPPHPQSPTMHPVKVTVRWFHRDGGNNGETVLRYWDEETNELLTFDQVQTKVVK